MIPADWTSLLFLSYLLGVMPWAAVKSRRQIAAIESADDEARLAAEAALPKGADLMAGTLLFLAILTTISFLVAGKWEYDLFGGRPVDARSLAIAAATLVMLLGLLELSKRLKSEEERQRAFARLLVPRSARDWGMMIVVILFASFAEEAAYRGLGMVALQATTTNAAVSAVVLSVAFGVGHAVQGWKNACIVGLFALTMHALVFLTGTLVLAMAVHALYDVAAILYASRYYKRITA